jgi:hypothetical protein
MVSRWVRQPNHGGTRGYDFKNLDYGKFGTVDLIKPTANLRLDLSQCSRISFRSLRDDGETHCRVLISREPHGRQPECWLLPHDSAESLLDDLLCRGMTDIN